MGRLVKIKWYNHDTKKYVDRWIEEDAVNELSKLKIRKRTPEEIEEAEKNLGPIWEDSFGGIGWTPRQISNSAAAKAASEARRLELERMIEQLEQKAASDEVFKDLSIYDVDRVNKMMPTQRAEWVLKRLSDDVSMDYCFGTKKRSQIFTRQRFMFYYALNRGEGWAYARIGRRFSKDHTTVLHGCKKLVEEMPQVTSKISEIYDTLNEIKEASNQ